MIFYLKFSFKSHVLAHLDNFYLQEQKSFAGKVTHIFNGRSLKSYKKYPSFPEKKAIGVQSKFLILEENFE